MEVRFADSFGKSLKKLIWHESKIYKFYNFFRTDIGRFVKNVWRFRTVLSNHYWWDHHSMLQFMETSLVHMSDNLEKHGNEVEESRMKKVISMRRAIELIRNYNESNYIKIAESELGKVIHHPWEFEDIEDKPGCSRLVDKDTPEEKVHNRKVYKRSYEIEKQEWNELFKLLKGQDHEEYLKLYDAQSEDKVKNDDLWNKWFDGSGINNWWD
jgi:hypothetical protein